MSELEKPAGVLSAGGDASPSIESSKDSQENSKDNISSVDEYIKPSDLGGIFSVPLMMLTALSAFFMLAIMTLTIIDVTGRYIFNSPVRGGVELIEFMLGLLIFSALPLVSVKRAHITVELFDNFMGSEFKRYREVIVLGASAAMIGFITERMLSTGLDAFEADDISMHLDLPMAPILFVLTILSAICFFVQFYMAWRSMLTNFVKNN